MKKSRLCFTLCLLLAATAMMLNSCSKDESDQDLLIGNWKVSGEDSYDYKKCEGEEAEIETYTLNESEYGDAYYRFNSNKSFTFTHSEGTYTGTWSVSGKKLTIKSDGEIGSAEIKELTDSKLVLYSEESESGGGCNYLYKSTTTLRKVK